MIMKTVARISLDASFAFGKKAINRLSKPYVLFSSFSFVRVRLMRGADADGATIVNINLMFRGISAISDNKMVRAALLFTMAFKSYPLALLGDEW